MKIQPIRYACDTCNENFTEGYFEELSNNAGVYYCDRCWEKYMLSKAIQYIDNQTQKED